MQRECRPRGHCLVTYRMKTVARWLLLLSSVAIVHPTLATHIRAGEITAVRQSCQGFTYTFTITGYEDTGSEVDFGDGISVFWLRKC